MAIEGEPATGESGASGCVLTDCVIEPDGTEVRINIVNGDGTPLVLRLSLDQVGSLAMTLPTLIERAVQNRYRDETLRYVYALKSWVIEGASSPDTVILTLATIDGFKASFGVARSTVGELADGLARQGDVSTRPLGSRRH